MTTASLCLLCALGCALVGVVAAGTAGERAWQRVLGGLLCGAAVVAVGYVWSEAPTGEPPQDAAYATVLLEDARYRRLSWAGMVPERDRRSLPLRAQALVRKEPRKAELRAEAAALEALYDQLGADPDFAAAGSPAAVSRSGRHLHRYFPAATSRDPVPVLLVLPKDRSQLAGWRLSGLAEEAGVALVVVRSRHDLSDDKGLADVHAAISWTMNQPEFRRDRVVLVSFGDSAGPEAAVAAFPETFRGLVFVGSAPVLHASRAPAVYLAGNDADFQAVSDVAREAGGRAQLIPGADSDPLMSAPDETLALIRQALREML